MRSYTIILRNKKEPESTHLEVVERLTFPEAAMRAYRLVQNMGYDWRVESVRENI